MAIATGKKYKKNTNIEKDYSKKKTLDTNIVVNSDLPIDRITQFISGIKWSVEYFNVITSDTNDVQYGDPLSPDTAIGYNRIENLTIYLESAIDNANINELSGSGVINSGVIPNIGDLFVAKTLGNRMFIFEIKNVTKNTYNLKDVYEIEFSIKYDLNTDITPYQDLLDKTNFSLFETKDPISNNKTVLFEEDLKVTIDLKKEYDMAINHFFRILNKNNRYLYFRVPGETINVIDTNIENFMFKILNTNDNNDLLSITKTNLNYDSILDILIDKDLSGFKFTNKYLNFTKVVNTKLDPRLDRLYYMKIDYMVTPSSDEHVNQFTIKGSKADRTLIPQLPSDTYIFTNKFYNEDSNITLLESLVLNYLYDEKINPKDIEKIILDYENWNYKEVFYYIPILLLLIKYTLSGLYDNRI